MARLALSLSVAACELSLGFAAAYSCSNYRVTGAGTAVASGTYLEASGNELSDGVPYFYKADTAGGANVFLFRDLDGGQRYWLVMDSTQINTAGSGGRSQVHYWALSSDATPPAGAAWSEDAGALPAPTVTRVATPFAYDATAGGCVRTCSDAQKAAVAAAGGCSDVTISGAGTASVNGVYYRVLPSANSTLAVGSGSTNGLSDCVAYYRKEGATADDEMYLYRDSYDTVPFYYVQSAAQFVSTTAFEYYYWAPAAGAGAASDVPPTGGWSVASESDPTAVVKTRVIGVAPMPAASAVASVANTSQCLPSTSEVPANQQNTPTNGPLVKDAGGTDSAGEAFGLPLIVGLPVGALLLLVAVSRLRRRSTAEPDAPTPANGATSLDAPGPESVAIKQLPNHVM